MAESHNPDMTGIHRFTSRRKLRSHSKTLVRLAVSYDQRMDRETGIKAREGWLDLPKGSNYGVVEGEPC
jgi:hypothetical protein